MESCGACGSEVLREFQFCPFCGAPLTRIATNVVHERRIVSVLFCDVVGFTATSERDDPEDVRARMEVYFRRVRRVIETFGGSVDKFIGDAVMAVFGVPAAHEDDAERAVRAALEIVRAIEALDAEDPALQLSVRVGVNTGEVLASLGAVASGEGDVLGDVVNTAARIQAAADVDGVLVGASTFHATEPVFEWAKVPPISAKGKAEPVVVWQPIAPRARLGSDIVRSLTTPLVGREHEFSELEEALARTTAERTPQLVTVMGEPGVGKSRLVAELLANVEALDLPLTWRQGRCLPYGEGITFWPLGEIVKAHAGIYDSDPADVATSKLDAVLPSGGETPWLRARLRPLLGLATDSTPAQQEELFAAWRRFLGSIAERDPLVLVVEDVHWAGEPLLAFLEELAASSDVGSILIVCTARPELEDAHAEWLAAASHTIRLSPLTDAEMARLVSSLLERAALSDETQRLLLERAGGNPLYAEEFVRMLRDRGLLAALDEDVDLMFPDSLQALIAARLDTLSREQKALLQDAAVFGKVFWDGALRSIGERDGERVGGLLGELVQREFVRPAEQSSMGDEDEYAFLHILVRDVAYAQIPRPQRADKHVAAATWLEGKAGNRLEDVAEVLAYHSWEALELARAMRNESLQDEVRPNAARYALLAGEGAFALDMTKAFSLLERARELTPQNGAAFPHVLLRWGDAAIHVGRLPDASDALDQAAASLKARGEFVLASQALTRLSTVRWRLAEPGVVELVEEAVALLEPAPGPALVKALGTLTGARFITGAAPDATIEAAERAIVLAAELGLPEPAAALGYRGGARLVRGDLGGLEDQEHAVEVAIAEGSSALAGALMHNVGAALFHSKGPAAGIAEFERAVDYARAHGMHALTSRTMSVLLRTLAGELQRAVAEAEELLELARAAGNRLHRMMLLMSCAIALGEQGLDARPAADELLGLAREANNSLSLSEASWPAAAALLALGEVDAARALLVESSEPDVVRDRPDDAVWLAFAARTARRAGAGTVVTPLVNGVPGTYPLQRHSLTIVEAVGAELGGDELGAARLYGDAARGWEENTTTLEQAHALLGEGRCLVALGDLDAERPLRRSRALFEQMGASPGVLECDDLMAGLRISTAAR